MRHAGGMPLTARPVSAYRADTIDRPASRQPTPGLVSASTGTGPAAASAGRDTRHRLEPCRSCSGTADRSPADPDPGCDECFELLVAYAGLEPAGRAAAEMPLMRAELGGRPACRDDYESLLGLLLEP